jgi:hypothetical protein
MSIDDIKDEHSVLILAVADTKTGIKRTFTVTHPEFVRLYRKYAALVPCTHPELKKYYKLCSVTFENLKNRNSNIKNVKVILRLM